MNGRALELGTSLDTPPRERIRWGSVLVRTNAVGATVFAGYVWQTNHNSVNCTGCALAPMEWVLISTGIIGAWIGALAWSRQRWVLVSVGLCLSISFPWGYFTIPSVPVVIGLATVAVRRAWEMRNTRRGSPVPSIFDLVGAIAFVLAAGMTVLTAGFLFVEHVMHPLTLVIFIVPLVSAWFAFFAWRRRRWLLAAVMFLLALPWWGFVLIFPPAAVLIGLTVVSLMRAWGEWRAKRIARPPHALR